MKPGSIMNLTGTWTHNGGGVIMRFKLGRKCVTRALMLEFEGNPEREFDVDAALAKLGYVKKVVA